MTANINLINEFLKLFKVKCLVCRTEDFYHEINYRKNYLYFRCKSCGYEFTVEVNQQ